ncbi:MAG: CDP-alcohol phosphatidyltransferase family protein [Bryobacteraceae bacterium]
MPSPRALRQLPNLLTAARILLTPFAAASIVAGEQRQALLLLAVASSTDGFDGWLARRFDWGTRLGTYLDPVADKLLLTTVYVSLWVAGLAPSWLVAIILGRDILILAFTGTVMALTRLRDFRPSIWGKISTTFQILAALALLITWAFPGAGLAGVSKLLISLAAAATVWSGLHYAWIAWRMVAGQMRKD